MMWAFSDISSRPVDFEAPLLEAVQFLQEDLEVQHHPGAHHQEALRVQGAAGDLVQGDALAVHDHGVAGIVAALEPDDLAERGLSRSTSLPLPSSPHCSPRMARFGA